MKETMVLQSLFILIGAVLWVFGVVVIPRTIDSSRDRVLTWRGWVSNPANEMITAQERELTALRQTVAIYKAEDEKRRTMTWDTGIALSTLSVRDGKIQYVISGAVVEREAFYRWLDEYMLALNKQR